MKQIKNFNLIGAKGMPMLTDLFWGDEEIKRRVVVYAHGFNGFKDWGNFDLVAERFASAGFLFVKFNFSHNGTTMESPETFDNLEAFGKNNYSIELEDIKVVIDWLCDDTNPFNKFIDTKNISLLGHSMGGGIAIIYSAEDNRIRKLVTWAAISECKTPWGNWTEAQMDEWKKNDVAYYLNGRTGQQMPMYYQLYEDYQLNQARLDIKKAISSLDIPVLICHGTEDPAVPLETAYKLKENNPGAKLFVIDSDHVFGRKHPWTGTDLPPAMEDVVAKTISFLADSY